MYLGQDGGRPGEGWLGGFAPAAPAVDPRPIFTFEIEVRNRLNVKPDFARGLCNRAERAEKSWLSGDLGTGPESLLPLYPGSWDIPQV